MIKALVSDFSRVILFPVDKNYTGSLNALHRELSARGDYDFWKYFEINEELLKFYQTFKGRVSLHIFTTEYIQEHPALQPYLEGVFTSIMSGGRLGIQKDVAGYHAIANGIGCKPDEVLYIDDNEDNVHSAREVGMRVVCYKSNEQTIMEINEIITNCL